MKSYKKIMPFLLTFALLGSAVYAFQNQAEQRGQYSIALRQARDFSEKGIVKDAIEQYEAALAVSPSLAVSLEAGEIYLTNGDRRSAEEWYEDVMLPTYPKQAETYLYGLRTADIEQDHEDIFSIYAAYQKRGLYDEKVEEFIKDYWYSYSLNGSYEETGTFGTSSGLAAVRYSGRWGYVNVSGSRKIPYRFAAAGMFGEYAPAVDPEGRAIYIDAGGNEKINESFILEKDSAFGSVTQFRNIYSGLILASNGTQWNYYDLETFEKRFGGYADATPVANGAGAVSKDGIKWALISADGTLTTDFVFDEVLADGKEIICRDGALLSRRDGVYTLIDAKGHQIGTGSYTDAKPFYDTAYAAVERDGRWIFIDSKGQEYDFGNFEEAKSFSQGYAAVKQNGKWGYIDMEGNLAIDCQFYDAGPFNNAGGSFVKTSPEEWQFLRFYRSSVKQ